MTDVALSIEGILERFPDYRVALVVARDLAIPDDAPPSLADYVTAAERAIVDDWGDRPVSELSEVAAWRQAYKGFGIRKTSYRPSVERLIRHVQRHGALPRVNALVDFYNAVSVAFRIATPFSGESRLPKKWISCKNPVRRSEVPADSGRQ